MLFTYHCLPEWYASHHIFRSLRDHALRLVIFTNCDHPTLATQTHTYLSLPRRRYSCKMANIPPWAVSLFSSLSEDQQATLVQVGARFAMDPWFGALSSVPLALALVYLPHFVKFGPIVPLVNVNYNNVTPRYTNWDETVKSKPVSEFIRRCESCHQNSWEAFIMFAPAVIMARIQKADGKAVRELCMRFLKLRLLYTILYIAGVWRIVSAARTVVWVWGVQSVMEVYSTALLA